HAEATGAGHLVGDRLVEHLLERVAGEAAVEEPGALRARLGEQPAQEECFELLRRDVLVVGLRLRCVDAVRLHKVSRSARSAPAALSARRIDTRSRGLAPSAASAAATSATVADRFTSLIGLSSSCTLTSLCATTFVVPFVSAASGCETCGASLTSTVSAPNVIAAVRSATFSPTTIVPVFSSTTTFARRSGSTS